MSSRKKIFFREKKKKKFFIFFFWNMNFVFEGSFLFLLTGLLERNTLKKKGMFAFFLFFFCKNLKFFHFFKGKYPPCKKCEKNFFLKIALKSFKNDFKAKKNFFPGNFFFFCLGKKFFCMYPRPPDSVPPPPPPPPVD